MPTTHPNKLSSPSTRVSPFRRPESPSTSPSTAKYQSTLPATPSRLHNSSIANADGTWTPSAQNLRSVAPRDAPGSPTQRPFNQTLRATSSTSTATAAAAAVASSALTPATIANPTAMNTGAGAGTVTAPSSSGTSKQIYNTDSLGKLPAAQVREMREAFQILDRNSDGMVDREDVADMLNQLGMDGGGGGGGSAATAPFFSPAAPHPTPMPAFLAGMAGPLAQMSAPGELLAALSAFDDDDSGQVDLAELTEALVRTAPEMGGDWRTLSRADVARVMQDFAGKRAFSKHSATSSLNKGDVFRYREWVSSLQAVGGQGEKPQAA